MKPLPIEETLDLFQSLGGVTARRMFGGCGFFKEGLMFALLDGETCFLKTDAGNEELFKAKGCEPFRFEAKGKQITMSYHEAPEEAYQAAHTMQPWAHSAWLAACRNAAKTTSKRRKG